MNRVCLVGCGGIARTHARNLMGKAELCFHSRSQESAERFAGEFGGGRVFAGFEELLEAEEVDGMVICSPPEFHCEQVVGALEAGKSVLVEKPMCGRSEEVEQIGAAVEAHPKLFVMVAENYYYKPSVKLLQWAIGQGFIGEVQQVEVQKLFGQSADGWKSGYGSLLEGGIHFVALISALFERVGQEAPERVWSEFPGWRLGEPERHSVTQLEYAGGATAVRLERAQSAQGALPALAHFRDRRADSLREQRAVCATQGRQAEAALLSGIRRSDGVWRDDAGFSELLAGRGEEAAVGFRQGEAGSGDRVRGLSGID